MRTAGRLARGISRRGLASVAPSEPIVPKPVGSANLDWGSLGFSYVPTNGYLRLVHRNGKWEDKFQVVKGSDITINITSNALHYGQAIFEGLKAFHGKDGKVRVFAGDYNSDRLNMGAERLFMPPVPRDVWTQMVGDAVRYNAEYVPPYGSNGSLYLRPMLFGHGTQLGLGPAPEYSFCVVGVPVGSYYKTGLKAVDCMVVEGYDRAAPLGIGHIKAAGNYSADVKPAREAAAKGFTIALYLDAKEHKYVEEFSTSNFIGITQSGTFVTPESTSVLPSVTNKILQQLAKDMGVKVEVRPVEFDEVAKGGFKEVAACGTAVVITPIKSITKGGKKYEIGPLNILQKLYDRVRAIQVGEEPDVHNWGKVAV